MKAECPCCGTKFDVEKKARSVPQHRRYFGMIRAFFSHWPETAERQFSDETELRTWAQMKAGYRDIAGRIPLIGMSRERALLIVEASIKAAGSQAVPVVHGGDLVIFKPRSISFASLAHSDACRLFDAVQCVLEQESGLPADQIMKSMEAA